jgi:hypothetical protein
LVWHAAILPSSIRNRELQRGRRCDADRIAGDRKNGFPISRVPFLKPSAGGSREQPRDASLFLYSEAAKWPVCGSV